MRIDILQIIVILALPIDFSMANENVSLLTGGTIHVNVIECSCDGLQFQQMSWFQTFQ